MSIDTGDEYAEEQIGFEAVATAAEEPRDNNGHGTAIGSLIRLNAPHARLISYRTLTDGQTRVESSSLLNALTHATVSLPMVDVICVAQRAFIAMTNRGQEYTLRLILDQRIRAGLPAPLLVCAAGNTGPEPIACPATMPGALIALALDSSGGIARYNCTVPGTSLASCAAAAGGDSSQPLGRMTDSSGGTRELFGSSFAAALVTASLAR